MGTEGLKHHNFLIFDGKQHPKIFWFPDFCSYKEERLQQHQKPYIAHKSKTIRSKDIFFFQNRFLILQK